jgi:hypothetical protein
MNKSSWGSRVTETLVLVVAIAIVARVVSNFLTLLPTIIAPASWCSLPLMAVLRRVADRTIALKELCMTLITDHPDGASRNAASTRRERTTLYAVVSNPTEAFTVRPKYGFAGEPIPTEYWRNGKWHRRLRRFLSRQLSRATGTFIGSGHGTKS